MKLTFLSIPFTALAAFLLSSCGKSDSSVSTAYPEAVLETPKADQTISSEMEFLEIEKENGLQPTTMRAARSTVGHEREAWRLAMQTEVDALRDNQTFQ